MAFTFIITTAGNTALINAKATGLQATVSHIAFGDEGSTPTELVTSLGNERQRVTVTGGMVVGSNQIHLTATAGGSHNYTVREVGVFLSDGTLFAVYSDLIQILAEKTSGSELIFAFDLTISATTTDNITIDGTGGLSFPKATTDIFGSVRYATDDEVKGRTNVDAAVKPSQIPVYSTAHRHAQNGYEMSPNGTILQWGYRSGNLDDKTGGVTFPIAFPSQVYNVTVTANAPQVGTSNFWLGAANSITTTGFNIVGHASGTAGSGYWWSAIRK